MTVAPLRRNGRSDTSLMRPPSISTSSPPRSFSLLPSKTRPLRKISEAVDTQPPGARRGRGMLARSRLASVERLRLTPRAVGDGLQVPRVVARLAADRIAARDAAADPVEDPG